MYSIFWLATLATAVGVGQTAHFNGSGPYTFDYLLGEDHNFNSDQTVLFVDYYDVDANIIRDLKAAGKTVICYVNVGGWEVYRSDAGAFPESVLGLEMDGWPDERWLDIRQLDILLPIMTARFQLAASKGCEGVDPDNMEGYAVRTGFPITRSHQITYNRAIMQAIRNTGGMMAGQKNAAQLTPDLVTEADFAVVEECHMWSECADYKPFIDSGRPVFAVEYREYLSEANFLRYACAEGNQLRFTFILKLLDLQSNYILICSSNNPSPSSLGHRRLPDDSIPLPRSETAASWM